MDGVISSDDDSFRLPDPGLRDWGEAKIWGIKARLGRKRGITRDERERGGGLAYCRYYTEI